MVNENNIETSGRSLGLYLKCCGAELQSTAEFEATSLAEAKVIVAKSPALCANSTTATPAARLALRHLNHIASHCLILP